MRGWRVYGRLNHVLLHRMLVSVICLPCLTVFKIPQDHTILIYKIKYIKIVINTFWVNKARECFAKLRINFPWVTMLSCIVIWARIFADYKNMIKLICWMRNNAETFGPCDMQYAFTKWQVVGPSRNWCQKWSPESTWLRQWKNRRIVTIIRNLGHWLDFEGTLHIQTLTGICQYSSWFDRRH